MNGGRHMAEACSGRLQPSMCFSHTVLREYGWRPEGLRYRGCAKFEGVTSTPRPLRPDPASRRWRRLRVWICPYLLNYYFCGPVHIQPCRFQSTPPHGGRPWRWLGVFTLRWFQSTPPHGGRLRTPLLSVFICRFNPRPRMGGDPF